MSMRPVGNWGVEVGEGDWSFRLKDGRSVKKTVPGSLDICLATI